MRKWARRIVLIGLVLVVLALLMGFTYEQVGRARDARQLPARVGQPIDIGGRTLNLYCSGEGTPTVILEPGGNSPGYAQLVLQSKMAVFTRTCGTTGREWGGAILRRLREPVPVLLATCTRRCSAPAFYHRA